MAFSAVIMRQIRGEVMRMLGGSTQQLPSTKPALAGGEMQEETTNLPAPGSKLKMSIEKKIENIWLESEQLGWSYNGFVSHLLEVLVVLNHRAFLPKLNPPQQAFKNLNLARQALKNKATAP